MKKLFWLLFILTCLMSCEEVVEIDLEESAPKLVIEASLIWDMEETNNFQQIKLTTTAPYFDEEIPPASGASVSVFDEDGEKYIFEETQDGLFINNEIKRPTTEEIFELIVEYAGEIYTATASFIPTTKIDYVQQENDGGFTGDNIELRIFYTDPADQENYYLFKFYHEDNSLQISNDELTNGNQTFNIYSDEELNPEDNVGIEMQGISEGYYEYLYILRSQAGSGGGPFQTQPTTVKGNIVNLTNPENFPFGYFRLSGRNFITFKVE